MVNLIDQVKYLSRLYDIRPQKSKGQNFLIRENVYKQIIKQAKPEKNDLILEVGPGFGFLTFELAQKSGQVVAVELDNKLAQYLNISFGVKNLSNVKIINKNVLDIDIAKEVLNKERKDYKIVANLPYSISSAFLRKFLTAKNKPEEMVLMLQKEVAERIIAKPPQMSILAVSVQFYAEAEIVDKIPSSAFWPRPKVDSALLKTRTKKSLMYPEEKDRGLFFRLVKIGFSSKRKMLKNNISAGLKIKQQETQKLIKKSGLDPEIRAQNLSLTDWGKLFEAFAKFMI